MVMGNLLSSFTSSLDEQYRKGLMKVPPIDAWQAPPPEPMYSSEASAAPYVPEFDPYEAVAPAVSDWQQAERPVVQEQGGGFLDSFNPGAVWANGREWLGNAADFVGSLPLPTGGAGMGASMPSGATVGEAAQDWTTPIPALAEFAEGQGDVARSAFMFGTPGTPYGPSQRVDTPFSDVAGFVGENIIPQSPLDLALTAAPGIGELDDLYRLGGAGVRGARQLGRNYIDEAARMGVDALPSGAAQRTVAPAARLDAGVPVQNAPTQELSRAPVLGVSPTEGYDVAPVAGGMADVPDQWPTRRADIEALQPGKSARVGNVRVSRDVEGVYSVGYPNASGRITRTEKGLSLDDVVARAEGTQDMRPPSTPARPVEPQAPSGVGVQQAVPQPPAGTTPPASAMPEPVIEAPRTPAATAVMEPPAAAASPTPPPSAPVDEAFAGNIRLSKYPEDVRGPIAEWAAEHPDEIASARRGVRSDAEVMEDARSLAADLGGDFSRLQRRWKPGEAWNAEEVTAIRGALREKTQAVVDAAKLAQTDNSAVNHANLLLAMQEQTKIQEIVHGVSAESGRALRAFRKEAFDAGKAGDARRMEELLRRVGDRGKLDDMADMIAKLDLNDPVQVNQFLRSVQKPKAADYIYEIWINSVLSGPKTHMVNAISNGFNALMSPIERTAAAAIDIPLSRLQGRQTARFFEEVPADVYGAVSGISEGVQAALRTMRDGISPGSASKWEFRKQAWKGPVGSAIRVPTTALEAADQFYYAVNYRSALSAEAVRQAKKEGLKGDAFVERVAFLKSEPNENLISQAVKSAEDRLFRTAPGEITSSVMNLRDKVPGLRYVLPFVRTPANLLKSGIARSPLGFLDPKLWRNLRSGDAEASDQLAKALLGSTVAAAVAWKFQEGKITGAAPTNSAERDRFYREGKIPFAINVGGKWVQYQRMEPYNVPLSLAAATVKAIDEGDEKAASEIAAEMASTLGNNFVNQTYMSGLSELIDSLEEPSEAGTRFGVRTASGLVPYSSALRTVAQTMDPVVRDAEGPWEQFKTGLPEASKSVPPRLTAFGEEVDRKSPAWSPIQVTDEQQSAVDAELERLSMEVGFVGDSVGGVKLSRDQQYIYQGAAGRLSSTMLTRLVENPAYQAAPDSLKAKLVETMVREARDIIRDAMEAELATP